jgi:hypothetical protein
LLLSTSLQVFKDFAIGDPWTIAHSLAHVLVGFFTRAGDGVHETFLELPQPKTVRLHLICYNLLSVSLGGSPQLPV